jgi:hypothetical protein
MEKMSLLVLFCTFLSSGPKTETETETDEDRKKRLIDLEAF